MKPLKVFGSSGTLDKDSDSGDEGDSVSNTYRSGKASLDIRPRRKCTRNGTRYPSLSYSSELSSSGSIKSDVVPSPSFSISEFLSDSHNSLNSAASYASFITTSSSEDVSDGTTDSLDLVIVCPDSRIDSRLASTSSSSNVPGKAADISSDEGSDNSPVEAFEEKRSVSRQTTTPNTRS